MKTALRLNRDAERGVALVIVLAFLLLMAGLVVAFLSRTATHRQVAHGSFNEAKADELAWGALDIVVADLKQEMSDGSTATTVNNITIYSPNAGDISPQRSGTQSTIPNLIRRSVQSDSISAPGRGSRASNVNSTTDVSANGRYVTLRHWNSHYLVPKATPADDKADPIASFVAPDWVIVTTDGPKAFSTWDGALRDRTKSEYALGRYAYAIYNEGGLLDVNVAGYPTDTTLAGTVVATNAPVGGKGWLALADLVPIVTANTIPDQRAAINKIIGWRNYATGEPAGSFPNFTFTAASGSTWFTNFVVNNTSAFLQTSPLTWNGRTDQAFVTRHELIKHRGSAQFAVTALQYMGTFSRELNNPTWGTAATQRVTATFTSRDGSTAQVGEPLVRRFPIGELAWLGPNGILAPGTAAMVKRDFGLVWNSGGHWDYEGPSGSSLASAIPPISGDQEPDFFQLLALAKPSATIQQILTTGACLIDQYDGSATDPSSFTTRIDYAGPPTPPSTTNSIAWGIENVTPPQPTGAPTPRGALSLNRPFNNVGEFGYANRDVTLPAPAATPATLDFYTASSTDAAILDLFGVSTAAKRAGVVDLNTAHDLVLRGMLSFATATQPSTALSSATRNSTATGLVAATSANVATSRQDLARLAAQSGITGGEEVQEVVARSLADTCQTRTWNLMIDLIAQSGRYPPNAVNLANFIVEGEKRYWLHIAIDRFTGQVIDQQLEAVYE